MELREQELGAGEGITVLLDLRNQAASRSQIGMETRGLETCYRHR